MIDKGDGGIEKGKIKETEEVRKEKWRRRKNWERKDKGYKRIVKGKIKKTEELRKETWRRR